MRDIIVTLIVFGSLPFILKRPQVGVLMWAWLAYMNPNRFTWGFAYTFPFSLIVGVTTLVSLIFSREPKQVPWTPTTITLLLFVFWVSFTTLFALVPGDAWPEWERMIKIQVMTFVTLIVMQNRERLHALIWVVVLSVGFYGFKGGIFAILTGGSYMVLGPQDTFFGGNTGVALALIMVLPLMNYLRLHTDNKWIRRGMLFGTIMTIIAIIASYSRGALVGGVAMGLFLWLKGSQKVLIGLILLFSVFIMFNFMPEKWAEKMKTIETYEEDESAMGRINAWWFAYNLVQDRPFIGGGFSVFDPDLFHRYAPNPNDFHDSHSIYFEVLGEHGFVGLALFLTLGIFAWWTGTSIIRQSKSRPELSWAGDLSRMLQVCMIGYATGGAFLGMAYFDLYYHLLAMLVLTKVVLEKTLHGQSLKNIEAEKLQVQWAKGTTG